LMLFYACSPSSDPIGSVPGESDPLRPGFPTTSPTPDKPAGDTGIRYVATESDLPECNGDLEGHIFFIEDINAFRACLDGAWKEIDMKGEKGDKGDRGDTGIVTDNISQTMRDIWATNVRSSAFIQVTYGSLYVASGSGFVVGQDLVATNGHVVSEYYRGYSISSIKVWFPETTSGDTRYDERPTAYARATAVDRTIANSDDIALISVPTGSRTPMTLSTYDEAPDHLDTEQGVALASEILLMGYSSGTTYAHFTIGRINAIQPVTDNFLDGFLNSGRLVYEYDTVSGGGSSGGALFDMSGKVIGLNFAGNTSSADTEFGYGVQIKHLRNLLSSPRLWDAYTFVDNEPEDGDLIPIELQSVFED